MRLSIPANYDPSILPRLKELSGFEIYGRMNRDVVGGGRPNYMAAPQQKRSLGAYIKEVHDAGLEFNYLMNSACLGNREWTRGFRRQFESLLDWLEEQKVETITVATPYLFEIIKKRNPGFKLKVGIYAQVDTVKRVQYWSDLGADAINLASFSINRDFEKLERMREVTKADLILITNHFCQPNCPYQVQHQNGHAHASGKKATFYIDYPLMQCQHNRLRSPRLFVSAGWIRPEDLGVYEKMGYTTFKLLERNIPSAQIVQRAQAYHEGRFDGNLAELLLSFGFDKHPPRFSWLHFARSFKPWHIKASKAGLMLDFLKTQGMLLPAQGGVPIQIDSKAIPENFLDHFKKGSCLDRDCNTCGYCAGVARKAVKIDQGFLDRVLPLYTQVQDELWAGSLW